MVWIFHIHILNNFQVRKKKAIYMPCEFLPELKKHLQYAFQVELKTNPTIKLFFTLEESEKQVFL